MLRNNNSALFLNRPRNSNKENSKVFEQLSIHELNNNQGLKGVVKHNHHSTLNFLSKDVPTLVSTGGIIDEKTYNFIRNMNSFRKHYHEYNRAEEKEIKNYNRVFKENSEFTKRYQLVFKNSYNKLKTIQENKHLSDIKANYEKKNYKIPQLTLAHNIFKEHPLLLSNAELYKYYLYQRGNPNTESNSLKYLNKLNDEIFAYAKENNDNKKKYNYIHTKDEFERLKSFNLLLQEIKNNQLDILRTETTLNNLNTDEFFVTNHIFKIKTERDKSSENGELEEKKPIGTISSAPCNIKSRDHSAQHWNHICSTRLSSGGKSILSRSNSINKTKKYTELEINEEEDNKTDRGHSQSKNILESLYEEVKNTELNNIPVYEIKNYFLNRKSFDINDHTTKGIFNQIQFIKGKMINKEYLNDNYRLKGFTENVTDNNVEKPNENKEIERQLLKKEKLLVRASYQNMR